MIRYLFFLIGCPLCLYSQAVPEYYTGTENSSGFALKAKLHEIISKNTISWNYSDLPAFYNQTDIDHYYDYDFANSTYMLDLYSNNPTGVTAYHYTNAQLISSSTAEGEGYNREHIMPQSTFYSNYPMYSDLLFVIPTDAKINQLRSNYPYGIVTSPIYYTFTNGSRIGANGTPQATYTGRVYEPRDEFKGDIARSLLYFAVRYEGKLGTFNFDNNALPTKDTNPLDGTEERSFAAWYIDLLRQWHAQDPPSPQEIDRNNKVFQLQKNRNPFIDHPEWVDLIWNRKAGTSSALPPSRLSGSTVGANFIVLEWEASPSSDILGYTIYQDGVAVGKTTSTQFVADHLEQGTLYGFAVKAYTANYLESSSTNVLSAVTLNSDAYMKDLLISKYIEGSGANKAIEITNKTGHAVNLNNYRISAQYYNFANANYYFPAPLELEGFIADNETFVILNPNASLNCITARRAKFNSNAPQLNFSGSNYVELRYRNKTIDAVGIRNADNSAALADRSLYRLATVEGPSATFLAEQWQSFPMDYCENIGVLSVVNTSASSTSEAAIFPNPLLGGRINVQGVNLKGIKSAQIFNSSGQLIFVFKNPFLHTNYLDVPNLPAGVYYLKVDEKSVKFISK